MCVLANGTYVRFTTKNGHRLKRGKQKDEYVAQGKQFGYVA